MKIDDYLKSKKGEQKCSPFFIEQNEVIIKAVLKVNKGLQYSYNRRDNDVDIVVSTVKKLLP